MAGEYIPGSSAEDYKALPQVRPTVPAAPLVPAAPARPVITDADILAPSPLLRPSSPTSPAVPTSPLLAMNPQTFYRSLVASPVTLASTPYFTPGELPYGRQLVSVGEATPLPAMYDKLYPTQVEEYSAAQKAVESAQAAMKDLSTEDPTYLIREQDLRESQDALRSAALALNERNQAFNDMQNTLDLAANRGDPTPGYQKSDGEWEYVGTAGLPDYFESLVFGDMPEATRKQMKSDNAEAWNAAVAGATSAALDSAMLNSKEYTSLFYGAGGNSSTMGEAANVFRTMVTNQSPFNSLSPELAGSRPPDEIMGSNAETQKNYQSQLKDYVDRTSPFADKLKGGDKRAYENAQKQLAYYDTISPEARASEFGDLIDYTVGGGAIRRELETNSKYSKLNSAEKDILATAAGKSLMRQDQQFSRLFENPTAYNESKVASMTASYDKSVDAALTHAYEYEPIESHWLFGPQSASGRNLDNSEAMFRTLTLATFFLSAYGQLYEEPRREERAYQRQRSDTILMERYRNKQAVAAQNRSFQQALTLKQTPSAGTSRGTPSGSVVSRTSVL